mgnify:CR=1 FL=1
MGGHFSLKRDYPQVSTIKLQNLAPESVPISFLWLRAQGVVENPGAPFLLQVGAFAQDLLLEVFGESVADHLRQDTASVRAARYCRLTSALCRAVGGATKERRNAGVGHQRAVRRLRQAPHLSRSCGV